MGQQDHPSQGANHEPVELTRDGRTELDLSSPSPLVGYCILNADDLGQAESLVSTMPIIDGVRVYEASSM